MEAIIHLRRSDYGAWYWCDFDMRAEAQSTLPGSASLVDIAVAVLEEREQDRPRKALDYATQVEYARLLKTQRDQLPLTKRQLFLASLVAEGLCNKEISQRAAITPGTVKAHLLGIFRRAGVSSRLQLAKWYLANSPERERIT